MDFRWGPEEEAFLKEVSNLLGKELVYPPGWRAYRQMDVGAKEISFIRQVARELGRRGWLSLSWPKEYGGRQAPLLSAILVDELLYHGVAPARDLGVSLLAPALIAFGTEEQKRRHLTGIARGEVFWCQGFTEPNAGSDLASVQLRAEEKDGYFLLNGQKMFISFAHNADWTYLLARTEPHATKHKGISFLLADLKTPGVTVQPLYSITGAHEVNQVFFDNVPVPKENLVGEKNQGFYVAMSLFEFERSGLDSCTGNARRVCDRLVEQVKNREVNPTLRQKLAEMVVELEVARWLYFRNAWLHSRGLPFEMGPPIVKVFATELNQRVFQVGWETLGLFSQLEGDSRYAQLEGELAFLYFSAVQDTVGGGTSEIQRNIIATRGLGLPRG